MITADAATTLEYVQPPRLERQYEGPRPTDLSRIIMLDPGSTTIRYAKTEFDAIFAAKLQELVTTSQETLEEAEPPNQVAKLLSNKVLNQLRNDNVIPTRVFQTVEGGIGICFIRGDFYGDIECLNDGSILGVVSDRRNRPDVWDIGQDEDAIAKAIRRIADFVYPRSAATDGNGIPAGRPKIQPT